MKRPTIAELEAILNGPQDVEVHILPNGEVCTSASAAFVILHSADGKLATSHWYQTRKIAEREAFIRFPQDSYIVEELEPHSFWTKLK